MAYFFGDGFDLYSAITDCGTYWDASFGATASLALSASGRFAGSRGLVTATGNATPYITKTSSVNDAVHHFSVAFQQTSAISGVNIGAYFTLFDGATAQCTVYFRSDGAIYLTSGTAAGATLATYTGAVAAANTWYQFEIEVVVNNTTGSIAVRKLGNTSNDFFLGSLNTRASANNYANKIGVGVANSSAIQVIDDFLWRSDASSLPWLGDIRCYTRMPASDASVQFTRSGSVVPVTPFVQASTTNIAAGSARYSPFIATCDGNIGSVVLSLAVGYTGNMKCSLFSNASGAPGAVLGSATPLPNPISGSNTLTFGTPVAVTRGTSYWIGFDSDTAVTGGWNTSSGAATAGIYASSGVFNAVAYASFPVANPGSLSTSQPCVIFTANITPTTLSNAAFVSEVAQDGAGSYVFSSTVGQSDLYNLGSLSATPGSIVGVTTRAYMQKSDAGTRIAAVQLQSGASNVQGSLTLNTTFGWAFRNDLVDPNTSAAWTATAVNNAQVGIVVTA